MIKWPFKMWLWGKDGIFVASNRPPDPGDDLIAISVYPADQVPEPVAEVRNNNLYWLVDDSYEIADGPLYLAPPSTIRQEERIAALEKIIDDHALELQIVNVWTHAAAIGRRMTDAIAAIREEKKG